MHAPFSLENLRSGVSEHGATRYCPIWQPRGMNGAGVAGTSYEMVTGSPSVVVSTMSSHVRRKTGATSTRTTKGLLQGSGNE